ncbi:uncharacterized protein LOC119084386 isoform X2 [Bradysia coprophila]|uniref:uncharacterized protein LOC119084386 isoform X2 n=1 Tax=Bradysia coprophila TaxID=38358 RepID=UPI00187D9598|nr:uncharacterized protein LOC119084386 isoform X2 [Bradysia coprophila]
MNRKANSFHRPYEIIETEETVTRYFDPSHSKVLINSTDNSCQTNSCCRKSGPSQEHHDPKITGNDIHLQALHEKFNKLRTIMSEVSEKFKEINSATLSKFCDDVPTAEVGEKKKLQENLDCEDLSSRDCNDMNFFKFEKVRVSIDAQSDHNESLAFPNRFKSKTDSVLNENSNDVDASLLNRSKNLLIDLIDNELQRLQSSQQTSFPDQSNPVPNGKLLKMGCIDRIAEELSVLKGLEVIEDTDLVQ